MGKPLYTARRALPASNRIGAAGWVVPVHVLLASDATLIMLKFKLLYTMHKVQLIVRLPCSALHPSSSCTSTNTLLFCRKWNVYSLVFIYWMPKMDGFSRHYDGWAPPPLSPLSCQWRPILMRHKYPHWLHLKFAPVDGVQLFLANLGCLTALMWVSSNSWMAKWYWLCYTERLRKSFS